METIIFNDLPRGDKLFASTWEVGPCIVTV